MLGAWYAIVMVMMIMMMGLGMVMVMVMAMVHKNQIDDFAVCSFPSPFTAGTTDQDGKQLA